ncbi:MAG: 2-oxoacid:acceptor oxidoreductase subunit alpha [Desulfovibrionaceae bacterium]|jgi:2-oxoglutarate ferredoxin oxidoreductase subunit alpha|nr:2-oxoacid:acceptor oxidoreductase subunit alpha [Desulfovibrionaceae bacterium]
MSTASRNIVIGGEAGQGLATVGQLLTKSLARAGHAVHVTQDYMSRIRGGHNTYSIRTGPESHPAPCDAIDILVALNQETVTRHKADLAPDGVVLLDESLDAEGARALALPLKDLAPKPIFENVAALGALCGMLGLDPAVPRTLLSQNFAKKGEAVVAQNLEVLDKALEWVGGSSHGLAPLPAPGTVGEQLMMNGNEAISLGAMAAGVRCCFFYPMTPGTSIAQNLINHGGPLGIVVEQVEDEIAALNMASGSAAAGARTIVNTSGGGLALMSEAVSMLGVSETPVVIAVAQRPGPATGLPTRTEQADLNLALYAGHGEFPRAIYTPGDVPECFELTRAAFDTAEKLQSPVFVLTDQYLADSFRSVAPFEVRPATPPVLPLKTVDDPAAYKRYAFTESGVSPRLMPGFGTALVLTDSHEHTEDGHITEDIGIRNRMQEKRLRKECAIFGDIVPPQRFGAEDAELLLVSWGSTKGALREAVDLLSAAGKKAAGLHFAQVWPLNQGLFLDALKAAQRTFCVELNSTGQFAGLVRQHTGFAFDRLVLKYDGRAITAQYIVDAVLAADAA